MLTQIHLRDFVIVDALELDIGSGMSVLTGETGAGKSILIDALGLALGDRGDAGWVRAGRDKAEITVIFDVSRCQPALDWLREHDLDDDSQVHLRRVIGADGRSRGYINGQPSPMAALRELGERLVDIHGQHEHQSLMHRDAQRGLLDDFGKHDRLLDKTAKTFSAWRATAERLETLSASASERSDRLELLRYQVQELDALDLSTDELPAIEEEHARLSNAGQLLHTAQQALHRIYEDEETSIYQSLSQTLRDLEDLSEVDPRLVPIREGLENARIQLAEASDDLRRYADGLDLDPERLHWLEQRLGAIHDLARKHHIAPQKLPDHNQELADELAGLENADQSLDALKQELEHLQSDYSAAAARLSAARRKAADTLSDQVTRLMQGLGMEGGRFEISLAEAPSPQAHGQDRIEFMVSANPGQPLKSLSKVASGGELSRISLAIQVVSAATLSLPALVFDEVDSGIGGGVAEVVGKLMRELGSARQVLCVTHLPQVAAQAHGHLHVSKEKTGTDTRTAISTLDGETRVREIARMLGGVELTEATLNHAREMIERAAA
ncbi:MAG: DNA repair protein RecN [Gammaproteobacteria bacterium]